MAQPNSDFISCSEYQPSSLVSRTEFLFRMIFSTISTNLAWTRLQVRVRKGFKDLIGNISICHELEFHDWNFNHKWPEQLGFCKPHRLALQINWILCNSVLTPWGKLWLALVSSGPSLVPVGLLKGCCKLFLCLGTFVPLILDKGWDLQICSFTFGSYHPRNSGLCGIAQEFLSHRVG